MIIMFSPDTGPYLPSGSTHGRKQVKVAMLQMGVCIHGWPQAHFALHLHHQHAGLSHGRLWQCLGMVSCREMDQTTMQVSSFIFLPFTILRHLLVIYLIVFLVKVGSVLVFRLIQALRTGGMRLHEEGWEDHWKVSIVTCVGIQYL